MKLLCMLAILLLPTFLSAQPSSYWTDITLKPVVLSDTLNGPETLAIDIGAKATIYLSERDVRAQAARQTDNEYVNTENRKVVRLLDKKFRRADTVTITDPATSQLGFLVSEQLQAGHARVYCKQLRAFAAVIKHRQEKYGHYASRFFYLPDGRPFYSIMELSGILEDEDGDAFSDPAALKKMGDKLQSVRQR